MASRLRSKYPSAKQKRKLIEMMANHPELATSKVTSDFSHNDMQQLWLTIANECNIIPGVKKTWQQWRRTWQDMKYKLKRQDYDGDFTKILLRKMKKQKDYDDCRITLLRVSRQSHDFKNVTSTTSYQNPTEFVPTNVENEIDIGEAQHNFEMYSNASLSEPASPQEDKVFTTQSQSEMQSSSQLKSEHSSSCLFNCDTLANQEKKKVQIKENYYNFKQDYLRQKLLLMKEQNEALKSIAIGLSKK